MKRIISAKTAWEDEPLEDLSPELLPPDVEDLIRVWGGTGDGDIRSLYDRLTSVYEEARRRLRIAMKPTGVSLNEWRVLKWSYDGDRRGNEGLARTQLVALSHMTLTHVTNILPYLIEKGLLVSHEVDGRGPGGKHMVYIPTRKARALRATLQHIERECMETFLRVR